MIDLGLVVARLLPFAAVTNLAGVSIFPLYAHADAEPMVLLRWRQRVLLAAAIAALFSGVVWFVFAVANMSGTLADVADREVLWTVLNETTFGRVWTARVLLAVIVLGVASRRFASTAGPQPGLVVSFPTGAVRVALARAGQFHNVATAASGVWRVVRAGAST